MEIRERNEIRFVWKRKKYKESLLMERLTFLPGYPDWGSKTKVKTKYDIIKDVVSLDKNKVF